MNTVKGVSFIRLTQFCNKAAEECPYKTACIDFSPFFLHINTSPADNSCADLFSGGLNWEIFNSGNKVKRHKFQTGRRIKIFMFMSCFIYIFCVFFICVCVCVCGVLQEDVSFSALVQLFDPLLSPRCYAVVGLKHFDDRMPSWQT